MDGGVNLRDAIITEHAAWRMSRRDIEVEDVRRILAAPEQLIEERRGRVVAQGMIGAYLLRVFVDVNQTPPEIVSVYRTSKVRKYRS
jgi:hypothetical protein